MVNLPSYAPMSPPLTGASKDNISFLESNADIYFANWGDDVVWSTRI